jgi:hypothetical protein
MIATGFKGLAENLDRDRSATGDGARGVVCGIRAGCPRPAAMA